MSDRLTPEQRSYCMSRIKGKNTGLEKLVFKSLYNEGIRFRKHVKTLPGKPDVVVSKKQLVVFIDGDFWHGYRFACWQDRLTPFWRKKIGSNIRRDRKNFGILRRNHWKVIRVWQHQIKRNPQIVVDKIYSV
jgi:DNA mismatch endonuclease (patch repair protein)